MFKSTDGGGSWRPANGGLTDKYVRTLAIDPSHSATLYAGTEGGGAFKFTDTTTDLVIDFGPPYGIYEWLNNANWSQLHPLSAQHMIAADVDHNGQTDLVVDFGPPYGIFTWLNNASWSQLHPLSAQHMIAADVDGK